MSDALSDIRKSDRNRPRYSQIEYEDAIRKARKEERERIRNQLYPNKIKWINGVGGHFVLWKDILESLR